MQKIISFLKDESGASAAEYALILAIIGAGVGVAVFTLGGAITKKVNSAATCIRFYCRLEQAPIAVYSIADVCLAQRRPDHGLLAGDDGYAERALQSIDDRDRWQRSAWQQPGSRRAL